MIIYDDKNKKQLTSVTLFLTPDEAADLGFSATDLSNNPEKHHHHVSSSDYSSEITIAVHTKDNLSQFDVASQQLIRGAAANGKEK